MSKIQKLLKDQYNGHAEAFLHDRYIVIILSGGRPSPQLLCSCDCLAARRLGPVGERGRPPRKKRAPEGAPG